ncbi:glycosyltransferase [Treponema putidum]|uniref:Glycosyltransferase n=1 Tax=Treponema putidum TaxID=221027 RepID=A0ABY5HSA0_9SPIR|nr:glycosyltransferase [Treponema putidum]UTY28316.1 glycosyltransferase [Treponema putidum]
MQENFIPLVSIVIPVYNGSNYMRYAIDSALNQTYRNIEVIVVNDGSTDNTDEIAKSYGNKIRYFSKENGGVSTALNLAIENMKGEYFSWLSHDDMYLPEKIESQINILKDLEDKTTVIYSGYKYIDEKGTILSEVRLEKQYPIMTLNKPLFSLFKGLISGCTLLIHISHFKKVGLFDISLKTTQDYDLWFKILRNGTIYYDINCNTLSRLHRKQVGVTNPQHIKNCCDLWTYLVDSISKSEIETSFSNEYNFLAEVYYTFSHGCYENFLQYIKAKFNAFCRDNNINTRETILLNELVEKKMQLRNITIVSLFNENITKSKLLTFFLRVYCKLIRVFKRIIKL